MAKAVPTRRFYHPPVELNRSRDRTPAPTYRAARELAIARGAKVQHSHVR
jgi:hypothetical protein